MVYVKNSSQSFYWNDTDAINYSGTFDPRAVQFGAVLFNLDSDKDGLIQYLSLAPTPPPYTPRVKIRKRKVNKNN